MIHIKRWHLPANIVFHFETTKQCLFIVTIATMFLQCSNHNHKRTYDKQLDELQSQYRVFDAQAPHFFLFGMGNREKYIYKDYKLISIDNDSVVYNFSDAISDSIMPADYRVNIYTSNGHIQIFEDEKNIWIIKGNVRQRISSRQCQLNLPSFKDFKYGLVLRVLHHELLININNSRIYPNIFVYKAPFYRDAFMAVLCLEKTGNTHLIEPWLLSIDSIYDMQNREPEADNLGELLYMLSFISKDSNSVFRNKLMNEIEKRTIRHDKFQFIIGHTDGVDNAEYQTQILKLALQKNRMEDNYTSLPENESGDYFDLCWFTKGNNHSRSIKQWYKDLRFNYNDSPFPYLQWARAHYYDNHNAAFNNQKYPLSWEKRGGSAYFEGMRIISEKAAKERICYPHAWTAAEIFLKLYEEK